MNQDFECPRCGHCCAEREWQGLTDEEIYEYADKYLYQHGSNYGIKAFGKAIEAKLREKNHG
jgi:Fe-S-cluster containining protein